jgi:hypothetical protein
VLLLLGVLSGARPKIHGYAGLIAHGPRVVAGLRKEHITRTDFALSAIVHADAHAPGQNVNRWAAWQESAFASGLTCSDQRHPGSKVARRTAVPPMLTTAAWPLAANGRVSSG